jgi:hypothetical protein
MVNKPSMHLKKLPAVNNSRQFFYSVTILEIKSKGKIKYSRTSEYTTHLPANISS